MVKPPVSPFRQRAWSPLAVSAALHLLLLATAAVITHRSAESEPTGRLAAVDETPRVDMIYVQPVAPPPPPAPAVAAPPPPPPPARQPAPEPEPNAPPDAEAARGSETDVPTEAGKGEPLARSAQPEATTTASEKAQPTMESEARRIFGRPRVATRAGAGPQAIRPMEAWFPDRPERCTPHTSAPADSTALEFGTVIGRIFRQDNGRPLAGAHLQMIGTPYVTFTDGSGEYRFRFDMALVDNCRTQYVRVTAAGYESRLLVLVVGPQVRSEDVRLRRR